MIYYILFIFNAVSFDEIEVAFVVDVVVIVVTLLHELYYDELILPPHVTKCGT